MEGRVSRYTAYGYTVMILLGPFAQESCVLGSLNWDLQRTSHERESSECPHWEAFLAECWEWL